MDSLTPKQCLYPSYVQSETSWKKKSDVYTLSLFFTFSQWIVDWLTVLFAYFSKKFSRSSKSQKNSKCNWTWWTKASEFIFRELINHRYISMLIPAVKKGGLNWLLSQHSAAICKLFTFNTESLSKPSRTYFHFSDAFFVAFCHMNDNWEFFTCIELDIFFWQKEEKRRTSNI